MFEPEVFRKQTYCIEESTCDIVGTFRRAPQRFSPLPPLLTPLLSFTYFLLLCHDRFTSELITENDEMRNPLVCILCSDYPRIVQKSHYYVTKQQCQYLFHSSTNY